MENLSMCRICLATEVRLCSVASHLRDMFERISSMTFKREDWRPLVACYMCHARLQNCYRLRTSCLRSEELITEMMRNGVLKPQAVLGPNTFRVVSLLHLSLGHALQDITECTVKEPSEGICDAKLDQLYTEDIVKEVKEELCAQIDDDDNNQCSHLEDPLDIIKEEADDVQTDAEYIKLEEGNIKIEEISWEQDVAGPSSQSADKICPKIVKVVSKRIDLNDSGVGARVSKTPKLAALEDTEDFTKNKRKIKVEKNEETMTIKEPEIVTKKTEVKKPVTSKLLETCNKVDNKLNKCDEDVVTSIVNEVCKEKSTNNLTLEHNVSSISSSKNKPFSCDILKKCFTEKGSLQTHTRIHTGEKPYQCNICERCFIHKRELEKHIRTHLGEKPYLCNICNKCFTQRTGLNTHVLIHTGEKPYQCNVCKKCFIQKGNLDKHLRTHTGEKPYQCNVCNKCFSRNDRFKSHILTHTGEKPYQCNVCKKCFSRNDRFKSHILTHSSEKPYQCNVCNKCFIKKRDLTKHIRVHTGENPYQCDVCNKSFVEKSVLNKHIRIHTEKTYLCNVCNKCFNRQCSLKKHIRTHTGEKP